MSAHDGAHLASDQRHVAAAAAATCAAVAAAAIRARGMGAISVIQDDRSGVASLSTGTVVVAGMFLGRFSEFSYRGAAGRPVVLTSGESGMEGGRVGWSALSPLVWSSAGMVRWYGPTGMVRRRRAAKLSPVGRVEWKSADGDGCAVSARAAATAACA